MPKINLASALTTSTIPSAGTVDVSFDYNATGTKVTLTNADIDVDKDKMKVMFDLASENLPSGASAKIAGVEFAKPGEPTGNYAPGEIFEDESTITVDGAAHTVFGKWKASQHELKLVDDNNVGTSGTEKDYEYRVWVEVTQGTTTSYYGSEDPMVRNKPTT